MQTLDGTKCGKCWWKWFLWASPQFIEFTSSWSHWWVFLNYKLSVARSYDDYWWLMRAINPLWHPPQIVGWWGYQRPVPKEADFALDIFQRTFPEVTTEDLLNGGQSARVNVVRFSFLNEYKVSWLFESILFHVRLENGHAWVCETECRSWVYVTWLLALIWCPAIWCCRKDVKLCKDFEKLWMTRVWITLTRHILQKSLAEHCSHRHSNVLHFKLDRQDTKLKT